MQTKEFLSLLQYCSSKASILQCSAFSIVRNSLTSIHDYWEGRVRNLMQSRTRCLRTPQNMVSVVTTVKSGWSHSSWCLLGKLVPFPHTIIFFWKSSVITVYHKLMCQTSFFWAPKSLQMVTAAMKLKDAYSLEGRL